MFLDRLATYIQIILNVVFLDANLPWYEMFPSINLLKSPFYRTAFHKSKGLVLAGITEETYSSQGDSAALEAQEEGKAEILLGKVSQAVLEAQGQGEAEILLRKASQAVLESQGQGEAEILLEKSS